MKNTARIPLSNGGFAIVDPDYAHLAQESKYHRDSMGYARTCIDGNRLRLHSVIMGKKDGFEIDHINRDRLDNRRVNLRFTTRSGNNSNRRGWGKLGVKYVQYRPSKSMKNPYIVTVKRDSVNHYVGSFSSIAVASLAAEGFISSYAILHTTTNRRTT